MPARGRKQYALGVEELFSRLTSISFVECPGICHSKYDWLVAAAETLTELLLSPTGRESSRGRISFLSTAPMLHVASSFDLKISDYHSQGFLQPFDFLTFRRDFFTLPALFIEDRLQILSQLLQLAQSQIAFGLTLLTASLTY